ncbi:hypothetical protein BDZ91DRAFT_717409 [Kalaharituber pfeilii]|nr:hypothetical protein BDZ91DRAFT_717409 [Kalaharituber pfeilii]
MLGQYVRTARWRGGLAIPIYRYRAPGYNPLLEKLLLLSTAMLNNTHQLKLNNSSSACLKSFKALIHRLLSISSIGTRDLDKLAGVYYWLPRRCADL